MAAVGAFARRSCSAFRLSSSRLRALSSPPERMNSTTWRSSSRSKKVDDHARAAGEVDAVHQGLAQGTRAIAKFHIESGRTGGDRRHAQHCGLLFTLVADLLERGRIEPHTLTRRTLPELRLADLHAFHILGATATHKLAGRREVLAARGSTTMRAEFLPEKHQAEAGRAGDGGEPRSAEAALRALRGSGGPAGRTAEGFGSRHDRSVVGSRLPEKLRRICLGWR